MKTFVSHINFIKIEKSQNFRNYIWDEFLPGWVLALANGKFECCRWFWDQFLTPYTLWMWFKKNDEFSWIFEIFICGSNYSNYEIGRYRPENHDLTSEISSFMLELHYIQNIASGEVIWPVCAIFPQKHPFFGKPTNDFFHLWVSVEYSTPSEISTIEKYGPSAFQRTFERPYSPPRSKVITIWSSKMLLSVSFPEMFHF